MPDGFDRDDFTIDHQARKVTCPNGVAVAISGNGNATFGGRLRRLPLGERCTTAKAGRSIHVGDHDDQLVAARGQAKPAEFAAAHPRRSLVERSIAWTVRTATVAAATATSDPTRSPSACASLR